MRRTRLLAAGLLCVTGVIHVARLGIPDSTAAFDALVRVLGAAYLMIGILLFRDGRAARYLGALAPLVGIAVGVGGGIRGTMGDPTLWMALLFAIDVVIVACCAYLIKAARSA